MEKRTVLLVEDDGPTRARLAEAVTSQPELELVGAADCLAAAREALEGSTPDVLLTDLGLPDGSGADLIRELQARGAPTHAMVITVFGDERHVVGAIEAGALGYLLKDSSSEAIGRGILELLDGGSPMSPAIARYVLKRLHPGEQVPEPDSEKPSLTEREREVLSYLVKGFTAPEVAGLLSITEHTVKTHIRRVYEKLEVHSRGEAVAEALHLKVVDG